MTRNSASIAASCYYVEEGISVASSVVPDYPLTFRKHNLNLFPVHPVGLDTPSFALMASLRARGLPTVGVANGYVFAGNAALLGCCDCIIATRGSSIGMGGPAMIEGGGLGVFKVSERECGSESGTGSGNEVKQRQMRVET